MYAVIYQKIKKKNIPCTIYIYPSVYDMEKDIK
jgi:hypothetical protein